MSMYQQQTWQGSDTGWRTQSATLALLEEARHRFDHARRQAQLRTIWAALRGTRAELLQPEELLRNAAPVLARDEGVQTIRLTDIIGSEGRTRDFDRAFAPRNEHARARWQSIAVAWQQGINLPPVRLIQVSERYLVRDGHHRISVAYSFGATSIDAIVEQRFAARQTKLVVEGQTCSSALRGETCAACM